MGGIPNTIRRGGIYHFRRAVPAVHRERLGLAELTCSLRTHDACAARSLSRRLYLRSEEVFDALGGAVMLSDADIAALVKDFYSVTLKRDADHRLMADMPDAFRAERVEYYRDLADRTREDLASNAFGSVHQITSVMLARRYGVDATIDKLSVRKVSQAMLRAGIEVAETLKARAEGDFDYEPRDKLLASALLHEDTPTKDAPPPAPIVEPAVALVPLFAAAADAFREDQLRRKVWERQTALQARKTYKLFVERFGNRPIASFTKPEAASFKALLEDLPANYGKAAEYRGLSASDIVAATKDRNVERLSSRTVQRHFTALSSLWETAVERGHAPANIFSGWKFAAAKRARDQRVMWTSDELRTLFSSPVWSGCQSPNRRSKPGGVVIRDEKFWLPLIAVFSGLRQEEICQLRLADLREVDGVLVFDVNARDGQQLKNANATRLVPVHDELARLGLLAYVASAKRDRQSMLFPQFRPGGAGDRLGHNYSKWFTRYRQDTGLYVVKRDFHSFRHSVTTFMARGGVSRTTIDEIIGHSTPGENARYNKGLTTRNLKDAMDHLSIGVDLSYLYP